ncbi:MAG TPA: choice-of-anchor Q domain-containing protein [bacterium]|nr:choice-of-anchor Q domain-containing protein [bacterium]
MKMNLFVPMILAILLPAAASAATFAVDRTDDNAAATACTAAANDCSLRGAVIAANAAAGDDVITLPAGTYTLTITGLNEDAAATGDLDILGNTTLNGAGAKTTIIDGNGTDRVLHVDPPVAGGVTVALSGLTIQNGHAVGSTTDGGGILNQGTLTLTNCALRNNAAGANGDGGGIYDDAGPFIACVNSTISGNSARDGGGILSRSATYTNCTVSGNTASEYGGGLVFSLSPTPDSAIVNSTITGNSAVTVGGGIDAFGSGVLTVKNSIVSDNSPQNCSVAVTSAGHNIDSGASCAFAATGDLSSTGPLLGPLENNGGPTLTHALLEGSPAIDAGTATGAPSTDQRGISRPADGNGDGTAAVDIGAFEVACGDGVLQTFAGEDCDDGNAVSGDGCSDACAVESGFTCTGSPSTCTATGGSTGGTTGGSTSGGGSGGCSLIPTKY